MTLPYSEQLCGILLNVVRNENCQHIRDFILLCEERRLTFDFNTVVVPSSYFSVHLPVELDVFRRLYWVALLVNEFRWRLTNHRWSIAFVGADTDVTNEGGRGIQRVEKRGRDKLRPHFQVCLMQSITSGWLYEHTRSVLVEHSIYNLRHEYKTLSPLSLH
jgi:hypothetical protein